MLINEHNAQFLVHHLKDQLLPPGSGKPDNEALALISNLNGQNISKPKIFIAYASCGKTAGAESLRESVFQYVEQNRIQADIVQVGCNGFCSEEPLMDIQLPGKARVSYSKVKAEDVPQILGAVFSHSLVQEKLLGQYRTNDLESWPHAAFINDLRFFRRQNRLILRLCGIIDPENIGEYISKGGYSVFLRTISKLRPEEVCDQIEKSGLRGRGGGGFLTAGKWRSTLNTAGDQKYVICNADESDPGSSITRKLFESNPHLIIEGLSIAAYASGASKAIIHIRKDYGEAIEKIQTAIIQAKQLGLLGSNIFGSGFDLSLTVRISPGAFVCGEETAMIGSIEGRRGMPQSKPPFPSEKGLFGHPTVVNNPETLANVPLILGMGPDDYRKIGTAQAPGTKLISLGGKTVNTGLLEVAMGQSIHDIVYLMGEGIKDNKPFKSIQLGGPSGYCLSEKDLDLCLDIESLRNAGYNIGSGGFIVMDDSSCMIDISLYNLEFMKGESCGKCIPCREGIRRMADIISGIIRRRKNENSHETLERFKGIMQLEQLATVIHDTSLCGLGRNASNIVMSTLKNFRDEYEDHLYDRTCRAGVCTKLRAFYIDTDQCTGCTLCAVKCPTAAIIGTASQPHFIIEEKCTGCGICYDTCKFVAIYIQ